MTWYCSSLCLAEQERRIRLCDETYILLFFLRLIKRGQNITSVDTPPALAALSHALLC